jgi:hypothetical protein
VGLEGFEVWVCCEEVVGFVVVVIVVVVVVVVVLGVGLGLGGEFTEEVGRLYQNEFKEG